MPIRKQNSAVKEKWAKVLSSQFTKEGTQLSKKPYGKTQMKISVPQHVTYQIGNNLKTVKDWEHSNHILIEV